MSVSTSSNSSSPVRILLVDDNNLGLTARRTVLEELGFQITTATNPDDALEKFGSGEYDLLITDYKMPRMNGVELIEQVRGINPSIPVILISGYADALGLDERNTGADIVLQKNANEVAHLLRSVNRLLKKRALKKPPASQGSAPKARRKTAQE
jgi:CheY-like chemotaxis protein